MTAYNRVNGTHMDMHTDILQGILRDQWSFDGLVMSDWGGTNSAVESVIAGCDLEMPGPPVQRGLKLLEAALTKSNVSLRNAIDDACRRVLTLAKKMNLLGLSPAQVRQSRSQPEQSQTSREDLDRLQATVASAHVLLKNSIETLPLCPSALQGKKIAFIGPNAIKCSPGGGGSATMNPQYQSHPVQAFRQSLHDLGVEAEVSHAVGAHSMKWLPLADTDQWTTYSNPQQESSDQRDVFRIDFFSSADMSGPVFETQYRCSSNIDLTDSGPFALREAGTPYSLRVTSQVTPRASGKHTFSITSVGNTRLWVGSRCLIDNSDWTERGEAFYAFSSQEVCASLQMTKGQSYEVVVEASSKMPEPSEDIVHVWSMQPSVRLGFLEELSQTLVDDAVALANCSDYTVS